MFSKKFSFLFVALGLFSQAQGLFAADYRPEALVAVRSRVASLAQSGQRPIVIFDLDDTLINTRERNVRILRDFAASDAARLRFADEAAKTSRVGLENVRYLLSDTLAGLGVTNPDFVKEASAFWLSNFFSDAYCVFDQPNPGAVSYVNALVRSGARIVYLTGRDTPRMGRGTSANLKTLGFPMQRSRTLLIMKPSAAGDDLAFKISQFEPISRLGVVVASFENEPANINAFQRGFPEGLMIFIDTIHSPKPDVPNEGVYWVHDFFKPCLSEANCRSTS